MISDEEIVASLEGMRAEVAELTATVDEMEAHAPLVPHRTRYLELQHALARRLLRTYTEWIDDVAAALRPEREPE
jgi:hypothetical protein